MDGKFRSGAIELFRMSSSIRFYFFSGMNKFDAHIFCGIKNPNYQIFSGCKMDQTLRRWCANENG